MVKLIGSLFAVFFTGLISCTVTKKAGYNWWLGLLFLVPFINIVFVVVFTFSEWPIEKDLRLYKERSDSVIEDIT